jgi:endo-1,4-beta-D-glucanase Y
MIYKLSIALLLMLSVCTYASGQSVPFPQDINYRFGIKPSTLASSLAQTEYNRFKNTLLADCEGTFRVIYSDNTAQTRGEAIGFGMLLSGYMGDKDVFDKLFAFYKKKRSPEAKNMMAWNVTCAGYANDNDKGSATDVDIDVAFALVIGYTQWGGDYLNEAKTIINLIRDNLIVPCGNLHVLAPGIAEVPGVVAKQPTFSITRQRSSGFLPK